MNHWVLHFEKLLIFLGRPIWLVLQTVIFCSKIIWHETDMPYSLIRDGNCWKYLTFSHHHLQIYSRLVPAHEFLVVNVLCKFRNCCSSLEICKFLYCDGGQTAILTWPIYLLVGNWGGHSNSFEAGLRLGFVPPQEWTFYNLNKYYFSFLWSGLIVFMRQTYLPIYRL